MTRPTFLLPALIAFATLVGLAIALTGDGWCDAPSWIGLALPLLAVGWARARRRRHLSTGRRDARQPSLKRTIAS